MTDDTEWKVFVKKGNIEAREYVPGEDLSKISVQPDYTPKLGDVIARNPKNRDDQWLISNEYFDQNYEDLDV